MASSSPSFNPWRAPALDTGRIEAENSRLEAEVRRMQEALELHKSRLSTGDAERKSAKKSIWKSAKPPKPKSSDGRKEGPEALLRKDTTTTTPRPVVMLVEEGDAGRKTAAPLANGEVGSQSAPLLNSMGREAAAPIRPSIAGERTSGGVVKVSSRNTGGGGGPNEDARVPGGRTKIASASAKHGDSRGEDRSTRALLAMLDATTQARSAPKDKNNVSSGVASGMRGPNSPPGSPSPSSLLQSPPATATASNNTTTSNTAAASKTATDDVRRMSSKKKGLSSQTRPKSGIPAEASPLVSFPSAEEINVADEASPGDSLNARPSAASGRQKSAGSASRGGTAGLLGSLRRSAAAKAHTGATTAPQPTPAAVLPSPPPPAAPSVHAQLQPPPPPPQPAISTGTAPAVNSKDPVGGKKRVVNTHIAQQSAKMSSDPPPPAASSVHAQHPPPPPPPPAAPMATTSTVSSGKRQVATTPGLRDGDQTGKKKTTKKGASTAPGAPLADTRDAPLDNPPPDVPRPSSRARRAPRDEPRSELHDTGDGQSEVAPCSPQGVDAAGGNHHASTDAHPKADSQPPPLHKEPSSTPLVLEGEVGVWLSSLNIRDVAKYAALFEEHEIDMDSLVMVTESQLREMGVTAIGTLNKIAAGIEVLRKQQAQSNNNNSNSNNSKTISNNAPSTPVDDGPERAGGGRKKGVDGRRDDGATGALSKSAAFGSLRSSLTKHHARANAPAGTESPQSAASGHVDGGHSTDGAPTLAQQGLGRASTSAASAATQGGATTTPRSRPSSGTRPPPVPRAPIVRPPRAGVVLQPAVFDLSMGLTRQQSDNGGKPDDALLHQAARKTAVDAAHTGDGGQASLLASSRMQHAAEIARMVEELRGQTNRLHGGGGAAGLGSPSMTKRSGDEDKAHALDKTASLIKLLETYISSEGVKGGVSEELLTAARVRIDLNEQALGSGGSGDINGVVSGSAPSPLQRQQHETQQQQQHDHDTDLTTDGNERPDFEIGADEIQYSEKAVLGSGAFAEVFRGTYHGTDVAVKRLRATVDGRHRAYFLSEAAMLHRLRHPNIILFLGACTASRRPIMVLEYMVGGSLYDLIHRKSGAPWLDDHVTFHKIARDIAQGMNFLHMHRPPIVHRDLKSPNVLLEGSGTAKISDFGFSRLKLDAAATMSGGLRGTPAWLAPEAFEGRALALTTKADVYAYGVILWEMASRKRPFEGLSLVEIMTSVRSGTRPAFPAGCPDGLVSLASKCWHQQAASRPEFASVLVDLDALVFPPEWRTLLARAGIRQDELADPATAMFVVDLVARSVCGPSPLAAAATTGSARANTNVPANGNASAAAPRSVAVGASSLKRAMNKQLQQQIKTVGATMTAAHEDSGNEPPRPPRGASKPVPLQRGSASPGVSDARAGGGISEEKLESLLDEINAGKRSLRPTSGPNARQLADIKDLAPTVVGDLTTILRTAFERRRGAIRESEPSLASSAPASNWTAAYD